MKLSGSGCIVLDTREFYDPAEDRCGLTGHLGAHLSNAVPHQQASPEEPSRSSPPHARTHTHTVTNSQTRTQTHDARHTQKAHADAHADTHTVLPYPPGAHTTPTPTQRRRQDASCPTPHTHTHTQTSHTHTHTHTLTMRAHARPQTAAHAPCSTRTVSHTSRAYAQAQHMCHTITNHVFGHTTQVTCTHITGPADVLSGVCFRRQSPDRPRDSACAGDDATHRPPPRSAPRAAPPRGSKKPLPGKTLAAPGVPGRHSRAILPWRAPARRKAEALARRQSPWP